MVDDNIQHGIDDDPNHDAAKGAKLGGVGGAVTGALAGAAAGPVGAVIGAVVGGVAGAVGSGAAVAVVDQFDNDNNISGVGGGVNYDDAYHRTHYTSNYSTSGRTYEHYEPAYRYGADLARNPSYRTGYTDDLVRSDFETRYPTHRYDDYRDAIRTGYDRSLLGATAATATSTGLDANGVPGVQTGGVNADGSPDSRGIMEKVADAVTGDNFDDKRGVPTSGVATSQNPTAGYGTGISPGQGSAIGAGTVAEGVVGGNQIPGIQTGGHAVDGTPDTRGITEKVADTLTGDGIDDKTGKPV